MTTTKNWFEVDKEGLSKLQERRGKAFVMYELLSNAWDTAARKIAADLKVIPGRPYATLMITDDHPEGWKNLDHAYTLFAESEKKGDPEKRGRFNLGEKLVLALCEEASIATTTGTVTFTGSGRTRSARRKTETGSRFEATLKMTREEYEDVHAAVYRILPPAGVELTFNGVILEHRKPLRIVEAVLPTEIADAEGILRRSMRKTSIEVVECVLGETAMIYEMGIPVTASGDRWHYNVLQKVPLSAERDSVTPAYLQDLRTAVLNGMYEEISAPESADPWIRDASADEDVSKEAIERVMTLRFGKDRVITDLHDPEANKIAVTRNYTVIPPRALSGAEWENVRKHGAALPAGQVTPSPKPFTPDGKPLSLIPYDEWTKSMTAIARYAEDLAVELLGRTIQVRFTAEPRWNFAAAYSPGLLTLSIVRLGRFEIPGERIDELLVHEFAHQFEADHLSENYHRALCRLAAALCALAIAKPEFFKKHGRGN